MLSLRSISLSDVPEPKVGITPLVETVGFTTQSSLLLFHRKFAFEF